MEQTHLTINDLSKVLGLYFELIGTMDYFNTKCTEELKNINKQFLTGKQKANYNNLLLHLKRAQGFYNSFIEDAYKMDCTVKNNNNTINNNPSQFDVLDTILNSGRFYVKVLLLIHNILASTDDLETNAIKIVSNLKLLIKGEWSISSEGVHYLVGNDKNI